MPELPEVETTRRGIAPHVTGRRVVRIDVYDSRLRWPVPSDLDARMRGRTIERVDRRSKYLLFHAGGAALLVHLGMTGSLRVFRDPPPRRTHDHFDIVLDDGTVLRYHDSPAIRRDAVDCIVEEGVTRCWMRLVPSLSIRRSTPPTCGERRARAAQRSSSLPLPALPADVTPQAIWTLAGAIARQEPTAHGVMEGRVADARANGPDERLANGTHDAATCLRRSAAFGRRRRHRA